MNLPETMPAMVLQGCNLFPHGILPLYIFEPRYRQMLEAALDSDRMFCIGTIDSDGKTEEGGPESPVYTYSTAGLIRACVGNEDGTSNLILQGIRRIRLNGWSQNKPFPVAVVEEMETLPFADEERGIAHVAELRSLVIDLSDTGMPINEKLRESIEQVACPEILADLVAYNFVASVEVRQQLLAMHSLAERYEFLIDRLYKMRDLLAE